MHIYYLELSYVRLISLSPEIFGFRVVLSASSASEGQHNILPNVLSGKNVEDEEQILNRKLLSLHIQYEAYSFF